MKIKVLAGKFEGQIVETGLFVWDTILRKHVIMHGKVNGKPVNGTILLKDGEFEVVEE